MDFKSKTLQPLWILTRLRGWPSAEEINPGYISVLVFCLQFGLMFGDIGQGAIFLLLGIYLSRKYESGMMKYLTTLFIPMGILSIIFGFTYDSIFLMEGEITHWIAHTFHISEQYIHHLSEHHIVIDFGAITYPIMPSPILETTKLMKLVFSIAAIEIIFGLVLGAINQIKAGNPVGALGEHGLGMILYVAGFYLTAMNFIKTGMADFMGSLGYWAFYLVIGGLLLSFLEPIIHSIKHGHGVNMEAIGEGIGGLMMTFVEGLANLFSFLRIAAFALAHASLAIAATALTEALDIPGVGLIIMNVIALSFEFVSSSVQSIRLLYYEFMGKFFQGEGIPFKPFKLRKTDTQ
jgi:V/A-type H+-transporting ATPase subunit I